MPLPLVIGGWSLREATDDNLDELMRWLDSESAVRVWGGPNFRFPFNKESFREDCHWPAMLTFSLFDPAATFAGFGQFYNRDGRINLARLIACPTLRGQGVGKRLVTMLVEIGPELLPLDEFSLYVYRDNLPALECYKSAGFAIQNYPADSPWADECYFLTRPVA